MLGQKLFQRGGRALTLTRAGHHVLSYAKEIFSLGQDLMSSVKQQPTARPLRLHLGVADALPKLVTYRIIEPIFRLPQPVQLSCWETKVSDKLIELAAYRLDVVLADEPASSGVTSNVFNHFLGECGVTFCAEPRLAAKLRRGFPKSLNGAAALLSMSNSGLRRSLEKWFHATGVRPRLFQERLRLRSFEFLARWIDFTEGSDLGVWMEQLSALSAPRRAATVAAGGSVIGRARDSGGSGRGPHGTATTDGRPSARR